MLNIYGKSKISGGIYKLGGILCLIILEIIRRCIMVIFLIIGGKDFLFSICIPKENPPKIYRYKGTKSVCNKKIIN